MRRRDDPGRILTMRRVAWVDDDIDACVRKDADSLLCDRRNTNLPQTCDDLRQRGRRLHLNIPLARTRLLHVGLFQYKSRAHAYPHFIRTTRIPTDHEAVDFMRTEALATIGLLLAPMILVAQQPTYKGSMPIPPYTLTALAPVLVVDAVEPSLEFWADRLGFAKENVVPGPDGKLIFGSVSKDGIEIMYQTRASVIAEDPKSAADLTGHSAALFITVPTVGDLDTIERLARGAPVVKARHDTNYGTTEFYIREPGGNVVGFSARK